MFRVRLLKPSLEVNYHKLQIISINLYAFLRNNLESLFTSLVIFFPMDMGMGEDLVFTQSSQILFPKKYTSMMKSF
jgi:hypothetical protein